MARKTRKDKGIKRGIRFQHTKESVEERFRTRIKWNSLTGCIIWTGGKSSVRAKRSYGYFRIRDKNIPAHRMAYELGKGSILPGYDVHHECGNTLCVNPEHLTALTREEHGRLSAAKRNAKD